MMSSWCQLSLLLEKKGDAPAIRKRRGGLSVWEWFDTAVLVDGSHLNAGLEKMSELLYLVVQ